MLRSRSMATEPRRIPPMRRRFGASPAGPFFFRERNRVFNLDARVPQCRAAGGRGSILQTAAKKGPDRRGRAGTARTSSPARGSPLPPTRPSASPREGTRARQHLVHHASKRPDIGALVHGFPRLLRRHVRGGAENAPRRVIAGEVIVGELASSRRVDTGSPVQAPSRDRSPAP